MYERILVPVDGSHFSEEVITYALTLAKAAGAKLALLRIADTESKIDEAGNYVRSLAARLDADGIALAPRSDLASDILAEARRVPNTLVTITTRGRRGLLTALLGSVARDVLLASDTPVLVYRPTGTSAGHEPTEITTVLLPLDGTNLSEIMGIEAAAWAKNLKTDLTIVRVLPAVTGVEPPTHGSDLPESSYVAAYASDVEKEFGIPVAWEVLHGDPVDSISTWVGARRDVLAVMATRGHSALQAAVLGSVTSGLVHKAGLPIILHAPHTTGSDSAE